MQPVPTAQVTATLGTGNFAQFSGVGFQYLTLGGEPAIPHQIVRVPLPSNVDLKTVVVSLRAVELQSYPGQWNVAPMPPDITWLDGETIVLWPPGKTIVNSRDVGIYTQNAFFPANLAGEANRGSLRGSHLLDVPLALFQFNPVTMALRRLVRAELVVTFNVTTTMRPLAAVNFAEEPPEGYAIITTSAIKSASKKLEEFVIAKRRQGLAVTVVTESAWGGGTGDIAADRIHNWLKANWNALGLVYLLLIGNPDPAAGDVPMKMLWPRNGLPCPTNNAVTCAAFANLQNAPSDYYYAELSSDWGADPTRLGDFRSAAARDRYQELRVGRIPVYSTGAAGIETLDKILEKLIKYGNALLNSPTDPKWRYYALLPMQDLNRPPQANDACKLAGNCDLKYTPGWALGHVLVKDVFPFPATDWKTLRMYRELPNNPLDLVPPYDLVVAPDYPAAPLVNPELNQFFSYAEVSSRWKDRHPGAVVWYAHGYSNGTDAQDVLRTADIDAAKLDDAYPAHTFQASCWTARPDVADNLTYALLTKGGINTIGATRPSYYRAFDGYSLGGEYKKENGGAIKGIPIPGSPSIGGMAYEYSLRAFKDGMPSGDALFHLRQNLTPRPACTPASCPAPYVLGDISAADWTNFLVFNIYGDPSIGVYTYKVLVNDKLSQLSIKYPPFGEIPNGGLYTITARFQNKTTESIQQLGFEVLILSDGAVRVENAVPPGGVGTVVPVGEVPPQGIVDVSFDIRLANPKKSFQFWVNAYDFRRWGNVNLSPYGDSNLDGVFTMADLNLLVDWILGRSPMPAPGSRAFVLSDVNGDNVINMADLNLFVDRLLLRIGRFPIEP